MPYNRVVTRPIPLVAALTIGASLAVHAQWLKYPAPGVPRTKTGAVNMTAPTPRDHGKPDLSGIWEA